jgi:hypothetical protein
VVSTSFQFIGKLHLPAPRAGNNFLRNGGFHHEASR